MKQKENIDDMKFKVVCAKYNLDLENYKVYKDYICLKSIYSNLLVILDKNYNVVDIKKEDFSLEEPRFLQMIIGKYENYSDDLLFGSNVNYKMNKYTLKDINMLADRVDIVEGDNGYPLIKINGIKYNLNFNNRYIQILLYVKYLNSEIKYYFETFYPLMILGHNFMDVYTYIKSIVNKMSCSIESFSQVNIKMNPDTILDILGGREKTTKLDDLLVCTISLLKRVQESKEQTIEDELEKVLKLLEVSDEEVKGNEKYQYDTKNIYQLMYPIDKNGDEKQKRLKK